MQRIAMSRKCLFPFTNITVNPNGTASPCCKYNLNKVDNDIEKETLHNKDIEELFHQPAMEKIRQQFLNGEEPEGCKACWDEESSGITSMRNHRDNLAKWSDHKEKYAGRYEDPKIITLDFKFSTLCNLKCRICGPYCSSNWLKESLDTKEFHGHTIKIFSKYSEKKFLNNERNFDIFNRILPNLHIIEFYGGEPLMQLEHARIMNILNSYPDVEKLKISLFYNTNGTIYEESNVETWKKMEVVEINLSLDDIEERFEYQRYPAKWNEVLDNIQKYKNISDEKIRINLYCTVSLYNIFYIDRLIEYNAKELQLPLRFNLLHWPEKMSIKHLPNSAKELIKLKLESLSEESLSYIDNLFGFEEVLKFMTENESSEKDYAEFVETTAVHDNYRTQSFKDTFLEYWTMLDEKN